MTQQNVPEQSAENGGTKTEVAKIYGNLGRDPVLRTTKEGVKVANFSVGENKGEGEERTTTWHSVSLFGKEAEKVAEKLKKGQFVRIEGKVTHDTNEKDGVVYQNSNVRASFIERCTFNENGEKHWDYIAGVSEYVKAQRAKEAQAKGQEADQGR